MGRRADRLKSVVRRFQEEIRTYQLVLRDPRTPRLAKWLLGIAVGCALSPVDLIPDAIPVVGHVDDLIVVPLLVIVAVKMVPPDVLAECRAKARGASGQA